MLSIILLNVVLLNVVAPIEAALDVYVENIFFVLPPLPSKCITHSCFSSKIIILLLECSINCATPAAPMMTLASRCLVA